MPPIVPTPTSTAGMTVPVSQEGRVTGGPAVGTAPQLRRDQVSFFSRFSDSTDSKAGPRTGLESYSRPTQPLWPQSIICEVGVMPCVAEGGPVGVCPAAAALGQTGTVRWPSPCWPARLSVSTAFRRWEKQPPGCPWPTCLYRGASCSKGLDHCMRCLPAVVTGRHSLLHSFRSL